MNIGILGAGQLGRMLALAGYSLGFRFRFLDPSTEAPAAYLAEHVVGDYEDRQALERFQTGLDVVTYEFENVPLEAARFLSRRLPVYPSPTALEVGQDRIAEKTFFQNLAIATPSFAAVSSCTDLQQALQHIGLPSVLKTRRLGYDGKGQFVLRQAQDAEQAWEALGGVPLILEKFIPFEREVSLVAVRSQSGATAFYPLVENQHENGILRLSLAPAPGLTPELQNEAESIATRALEALDYVGALALEYFQYQGRLWVNEMAPRVHNSGHWTIEGARTSQFENHLRAVAGLPLGLTEALGHSAMVNLIGTLPRPDRILDIPGAHLHLYGKAPRPDRKLGHVTLTERNETTLRNRLDLLWKKLETADTGTHARRSPHNWHPSMSVKFG